MSAGDDGIDEKKIREYICVLCTSLQCIHEQKKLIDSGEGSIGALNNNNKKKFASKFNDIYQK